MSNDAVLDSILAAFDREETEGRIAMLVVSRVGPCAGGPMHVVRMHVTGLTGETLSVGDTHWINSLASFRRRLPGGMRRVEDASKSDVVEVWI
ncbi:hypothetical protein [Thaumasiovibrio sp. DFM-14]|uniref:hypothetical protein n=1 Tax=Thaumasiovibrio sp. DFM-14 TaxID=3384792 RepID=UPI0039A0CB6E